MTPELKELLKESGLEAIEESTKVALINFIKVAPALARLTENKLDDVAVMALPVMQPMLLDLVDLINPADNE